MPPCHRQDDLRVCQAKTVVTGQDFVRVDGKLWAVKDDPNNHGNGALINSQDYVFINGKPVILRGDQAHPDNFCPLPPHCDPIAVGFDPLVVVN